MTPRGSSKDDERMTEDTLNYPKMVERALRGVLREVLTAVAEGGLSDQHHLYITFRTTAPGVQLADRLRAQYPDDMTIVLQHKFWGSRSQTRRSP